MIVVRRAFLVATTIATGLTALGLGVYGFTLLGETRLEAERFFYVALLAAILLVTLVLTGILKAEALDRRLNRLIAQGNSRDILPDRDFQALGSLGDKLAAIFAQVGRQNELKTRKISGLHDLVEFLVRNQDRPVAVCDASGIVRYANEEGGEAVETPRIDLIGESLAAARNGFSMNDLIAKLLQTRQPAEGSLGERDFVAYPIEDRSGELAYIIVFFGTKARFFRKPEQGVGGAPKRSNSWSANLSRFLSRSKRPSS